MSPSKTLVVATLLLLTPGCTSKPKSAPPPSVADETRIWEERSRRPSAMQEALRPFNEGVAYLMRHRRDLGLTEDQVEDLLELRNHADRDVHEIEARMHSLADEMRSQLHVGGLDGPDITDQLQQMGELQAKIDQRRLAALAKGIDLLKEEQRAAFDDILLRDIQ